MPLIRVVSRMGRPLAVPMQASFGAGGGTLGRSPDCTLTLPDESRHVSRRQARVDVSGGVASITCLSAANPLIVNGEELHSGQARPLADGDRIHIAEYELRFESETAPSAGSGKALIPDDPFALDPSPDLPTGPAPGTAGGRGAGAPAARRDRGFGTSVREHGPGAPAIPDAFDPFDEAPPSPLHQSGRAPQPSGADPLGLGLESDSRVDLPAGKGDSIDALFGLEPAMDPFGPDSPLGRNAGEVSSVPKRPAYRGSADPVADDASVLAGSFRLPQAIPPTEFNLPEDPVLSWHEADATREAILPPAPTGNAAELAALTDEAFDQPPPSAPQSAPQSAPDPSLVSMPAGQAPLPPASRTDEPPATSNTLAGRQPAESPGTQELLRALLDGLGLPELPRAPAQRDTPSPTLTPEMMQRLGALLAAAAEGTVELLQARATLKQELRADVTMIGSRDNNPLKFVPDGESALNQLLASQPARGFMEPRLAMRDAYDDLLAHQIGFVAGMRAAMQGLIARFDPQVLETRLAGKSVLDSMLPAARKARLWELFNNLYSDVSREAEDDFERLFGRAFVKAYEEQIARIEASTRPGK